MTLPLPARRLLIALAVVASLISAVATVEAAAAWTARSAPLGVAPESVDSLSARLAAESARSTALQDELDALRAHATDLSSALQTATDQIATDTTAAQALRGRLAAAKARLAALERVIASAKSQAAQGAVVHVSSGASNAETEHEGVDDD